MTPEARVEQINALLPALQSPVLAAHLREEIAQLTARLVSQDNEQTRGRIKALTELLDSPAALLSERSQIAAALPEQSDAAQ